MFKNSKRIRSQKRQFIRSYNHLLKQGEEEVTGKILYDLIDSPFVEKINSSSLLRFIKTQDLYSCSRQFLMTRVLDFEFIEQLTLALYHPQKEIKHPLPPMWRDCLEKFHGVRANTLTNRLLWLKFLIYWFSVGYLSAVYEWLKNCTAFKNNSFKKKPYNFFIQLTKENMPLLEKGVDSENTIISWFVKHNENNESIFSNVKLENDFKVNETSVFFSKSPWPRVHSPLALLSLVGWCLLYYFFGIYQLIRGNYIFPMLTREIMLARLVKATNAKELPKRYMFHNSGFFFRPLWTYLAERKGSKIIHYYYSTSDLWIQTKKGDMNRYNPYQIMTWPTYWVWDQYQLSFLKKYLDYPFDFKIVGPTWFSSSSLSSLTKLPKKGIAIFDIEPFRDSYQYKIWYPVNFYGYTLSKQFFNDLNEIALKHKIHLFIKRKRNNKNSHKGYLKLLREFSKSPYMHYIEPNIAAKSLIEISHATITMPFSTPANIAFHLGKPTVYYDPIRKTVDNDPAARGIAIIRNKSELENWILNIYKNEYN